MTVLHENRASNKKSLSKGKLGAIQEFNIGISSQGGMIFWALLSSSNEIKTKPTILSWGMDIDASEFEIAQQELLKMTSGDRIYLSSVLEASKSLYRKASIPVTIGAKDRVSALQDTLERALPPAISLSSENGQAPYVVAAWIREKSDEAIMYDAYIADRHDLIRDPIHPVQNGQSLGQVEAIFPKSACLHIWAERFLPKEIPYLILDVSIQETTAILYINGEIELMRCIPSGITALRGLDVEKEASEGEAHVMALFFESIEECVAIAATKLQEKLYQEISPTIVFTGPIVSSQIYLDCISAYIKEHRHNVVFQETSLENYVVAGEIGAALFGSEKNLFSNGESVPDFLKMAQSNQEIIQKHVKRPFFYLMATSLFLSILIFFWSLQDVARIEEIGRKGWQNFQKQLQVFPFFESERRLISESQSAPLLEQEAILESLQSEVQKRAGYTLLPRVPTLSQTLTTIDEIIATIQKNQGSENKSTLELQSLKYSMVKRPDLKHPKDQYQVRVDIDFTSSSQAVARSFYDALLLSKTLVDAKSDVKWSVTNGRYKTSFYLKI